MATRDLTLRDGGGQISRRVFIRVAAGGAAALPLILEACGGSSAPASSAPASSPASSPASGSAVARVSAPASAAPAVGSSAAANASVIPGAALGGKNAAALPTYIAPKLVTQPDFNANDPRVMLGFNHYPKNPPKSWTKDPPGTGKDVSVFVPAYYPPPTPYDQNPTWQAVNKALNANVQMNIVAGADYQVKLATLQAGSDLPDIVHLFFGIGAMQSAPDFFKAKGQDLTKFLAGDAIKDYPNLAAIPTYAWNNSDCVIDGQLWMWPIHRYLPGLSYLFKNTDAWNAKAGADTVPKNADDLKKIMLQVNDPKGGMYAVGNAAAAPFNFGLPGYAQIFGAPNMWGMDDKGGVVKDWETPQFKAAIGYVQDLWKAGVMYPDATSASFNSRSDFVGKKFVMEIDGFGNSWNDFWLRGLTTQKPPTNFDMILPFSADANTKVQSYITGGFVSTNMMKKQPSDDRVKELLRILDYLAKPFGTQEDLLITYGLTPADYTIDANGDPQLTSDGKNRSQYVPWQYVIDRPYVEYYAGIPDYASKVFAVEKVLVDPKIAVPDATLGYYSASAYGSKARPAQTDFLSAVNDIILGRRPITDYDGLVKTWQDAIGNQIKKEYNDAIQSAKK